MTKPDITGIAPFFIVRNVPAALSFYRDRLGFDITFQGPDPDDIFFGIVQRGAATIMFKDVGVDPVPNYTWNIKKGIARWDAYLHVADPDALAAEFSSRNVEFFRPLFKDDDGDRLWGFELNDADGYVLFFGRPRWLVWRFSWRWFDVPRRLEQPLPPQYDALTSGEPRRTRRGSWGVAAWAQGHPMIRLIGPGGAGKSTIGVLLAERLGVPFVDLDRQFASRAGDISEYIGRHGYDAYARENVETYCSLSRGGIHPEVLALSSGFMTYARDAHRDYGCVRRELEECAETFILLPSLDRELCVAETVRRQVTRPFGRPPEREEAVIRARFEIYMAFPIRKIETMRPPAAIVDEILAALIVRE